MRALVFSLVLLFTGCATFNGKEAAGFTTLHPSDRTEIYFVCEKYYHTDDVKHEHEHIHCDKNHLIQFGFKF